MKYALKFWKFINKDVANANETKKVAVITRLYALIMCVYFSVIMLLVGLVGGHAQDVVIGLVFLSVYVFLFYCSYMNNTKRVSLMTQVVTVVWILYGVHLFGWDFGIQNMLMALLVLMLLTSYGGVKFKLFMAVVASLFMVVLYEYSLAWGAQIRFENPLAGMMQWLHIVINITMITVLMLMFSHDSIKMEKKLVDYNERIRQMASIDPLTGLKNRRSMMEYLQKLIDSKDINNQFSIAIGDIDFFKKINDTYGHDVGDEVLKGIAELMEEYMQGKGSVSRWGGEEFLLVFSGMNGDQVFVELESLRAKVEKLVTSHADEEIRVTMTFGMDEYDPAQPIDSTINSADKKLYIGKKTGRNKVVF